LFGAKPSGACLGFEPKSASCLGHGFTLQVIFGRDFCSEIYKNPHYFFNGQYTFKLGIWRVDIYG
jgi:hypothetical protein